MVGKFQFHKGTIRTEEGWSNAYQSSPFQFHKGTIRTGLSKRAFNSSTYFNSIKVQLELTNSDGSQSAFALISIP